MNTKYVVRIVGGTWRASFNTLEEAKQHASTSWEFKDNVKTVIEKVVTEQVWSNKKESENV